ncbi:MAG TPA: C45 family peptidase [Gemmataceae bacterium]|nr:C45 family peptidase [Gemmataceae bacterium]
MPRPRFLLLLALVILVPLPARAAEPFRYTEGKHGKAELRSINGVPVLMVEGTPDEIGEQTGTLTKDALKRLFGFAPEFLKAHGYEKAWPQLLTLAKSMVPQFPPDHLKEMDALVKASGQDRDLAIAGNTFADIKKIGGCSTLIVEADRSATKAPLFGRNLDYPTMGFLHEYSLVTVCRPKGKHAFASVGFPGFVGVLSGMNDAGLSLATLEVYSAKDRSLKFDPKGVPYALVYRRILEECTTVEEAEKLLRSVKRTTMNNLAICDRNGGAVFEITPKSVVVRRPEKCICPCTNHFRTPELATKKECRRYDALMKCCDLEKLTLADVARHLHAANQGANTLQTMIFEPKSLKLHVALGKGPSSALPMKELELEKLFNKEGKR